MFNITTDIQPMTTFRRHPSDFMRHLKETQRPLILTVNGKAEAVIMAAMANLRVFIFVDLSVFCFDVRWSFTFLSCHALLNHLSKAGDITAIP